MGSSRRRRTSAIGPPSRARRRACRGRRPPAAPSAAATAKSTSAAIDQARKPPVRSTSQRPNASTSTAPAPTSATATRARPSRSAISPTSSFVRATSDAAAARTAPDTNRNAPTRWKKSAVLASDREEKLLQLAQAGGELDALVAGQVEEHVAQEPRLVALDSERWSEQGRGGSDKLVTQGPELPEVRGVRSVDERVDSLQHQVDVAGAEGDRACGQSQREGSFTVNRRHRPGHAVTLPILRAAQSRGGRDPRARRVDRDGDAATTTARPPAQIAGRFVAAPRGPRLAQCSPRSRRSALWSLWRSASPSVCSCS